MADAAGGLQRLLHVHLGLVDAQVEPGVRPVVAQVAVEVFNLHKTENVKEIGQ